MLFGLIYPTKSRTSHFVASLYETIYRIGTLQNSGFWLVNASIIYACFGAEVFERDLLGATLSPRETRMGMTGWYLDSLGCCALFGAGGSLRPVLRF